MTNELGDVELDARGVRALAHPVRLAILLRLRADGPSTATRLSPMVGASPSVTSWHLRHLAEHGLVEDAPGDHGGGRSRWWRVVGSGFRFDVDPRDPAPGIALLDLMEQAEGDLVTRWASQTRPHLEPEWLAVASRWNTGVLATPDEIAHLETAMEALLAPLANRSPESAPEGSRRVRILRYVMPAAAPDDD
ncbi:putative ArsR-family transcriptional regulator [Nostocoides japonicum T1-X7]|uniref:Putative ArsR-family transcriptional regulator n=1 Tax=Nostocoides japonicum T1-X7 TaxID=1194083 RepID=A0A077M2Z7_9MICO|nr:helix-turn-helix domain-containing protein [Tetrasphaera japonica]CCH80146.1 putative ArsR-family transcriptional regulator [Tetrasphaera japonica T1-X7]